MKAQSASRGPVFSSHLASAIYLNNVGVSLMERCCYQEALETFQNAQEVKRAKPSQALVEHTVYRAYLHLSSSIDNCSDEDDSRKCSSSDRAIPIVYDQYGNNSSVSLPSKENRTRSSYSAVMAFGRSKTDVRPTEYFLIYFQTNHRHGQKYQTNHRYSQKYIIFLLRTALLVNCRQAQLLVERI